MLFKESVMRKKSKHLNIPVLSALLLFAFPAIVFSGEPLKVFILAGQSNMQGHGELTDGSQGNLQYMVDTDPATFGHLKNGGDWAARDDVWIYYERDATETLKGKLTAGMGAFNDTIGPELQFGNFIGDIYDGQVLLIKTAWGGKSLAVDYRPPSSGGTVGPYYTLMMSIVNDVLANLSTHFPTYNPADGYEIAGFGWHQGWNDRINQTYNDEYEFNMKNFINDVRSALGTPKLPFVIATTGMSGWSETHPRALSLMEAQLAMADASKHPEFEGNVASVETRGFYRTPEESPSSQGYHWNRNAETYFLIGNGMAEEMARLRVALDAERPIANPFGQVFLDLISNELLWEKQISPTVSEYCFRMKVKNLTRDAAENVTVKISSVPDNITVVNDKVFFASLPGLQEGLCDDTFTVIIDHSESADQDDLLWEISGEIETRLSGDIDLDFKVGLSDLELFTDNWLGDYTSEGLRGYWAVGDNAGRIMGDLSGNGNDGVLFGTPATADGVTGKALNFAGDNYAIANGICDDIAGGDFTLSLWIKSDSIASQQFIASFNTVTGGNRLLVGHQADSANLRVHQGAWIDSGVAVFDGTWHHIALVLDNTGNRILFYVDGNNVLEHSGSAYIAADDLFSLGHEYDPGPVASDFYIGLIDDAAIYNRILTPEDVQLLYNNPESKPTGDVNHDGKVNLADLARIAEDWQTQN